jgi:hypothetical protein
MATATFASNGHRYEFDGRSVPSVTQVLAISGITDVSKIPQHILDRAAAIGTAVHQACDLLDQDDLDLESLDPLLVGYASAYQRFRQETSFMPELIEHRAVGTLNGLRYGFCVDRLGQIGEERVLLDLKTSSKAQLSWPIQTMAYSLGLGCIGVRRGVVHLAKDGTYKLLDHLNHESDSAIWEAALAIAHWKLAHRWDGTSKEAHTQDYQRQLL